MEGRRKDQFNVFERIDSVKKLCSPVCPIEDSFRLRGLIMRCVKFQVKQAKSLKKDESQVYDLLWKHNMNPKTVYEWLLLEDVPPHLKAQLVQNKISLETARHQYVQWKRMSNTRAGKEIMEEMRNTIRRLRWKSQEELPMQY